MVAKRHQKVACATPGLTGSLDRHFRAINAGSPDRKNTAFW